MRWATSSAIGTSSVSGTVCSRRKSGRSPNTATAWRSGTRSRRWRRSASTWALRAWAWAGELVAEPGVLGLERHHPADPFEVHPLGGQLGDASQYLDVGVGVAAIAALRARRVEQPATLVAAQRLGMHPGQLGGDRDDVHGSRSTRSSYADLRTCWRRGAPRSAARCSRVRSRGTATSIVTIRSPVPFGVEMPLPLTR